MSEGSRRVLGYIGRWGGRVDKGANRAEEDRIVGEFPLRIETSNCLFLPSEQRERLGGVLSGLIGLYFGWGDSASKAQGLCSELSGLRPADSGSAGGGPSTGQLYLQLLLLAVGAARGEKGPLLAQLPFILRQVRVFDVGVLASALLTLEGKAEEMKRILPGLMGALAEGGDSPAACFLRLLLIALTMETGRNVRDFAREFGAKKLELAADFALGTTLPPSPKLVALLEALVDVLREGQEEREGNGGRDSRDNHNERENIWSDGEGERAEAKNPAVSKPLGPGFVSPSLRAKISSVYIRLASSLAKLEHFDKPKRLERETLAIALRGAESAGQESLDRTLAILAQLGRLKAAPRAALLRLAARLRRKLCGWEAATLEQLSGAEPSFPPGNPSELCLFFALSPEFAEALAFRANPTQFARLKAHARSPRAAKIAASGFLAKESLLREFLTVLMVLRAAKLIRPEERL